MLDKLIQELDQSDSEVRAQVREQLIRAGADAVELLIAALQSPNVRISWQAAIVLEKIPDPRWIQPMISAINSSNILLGQAAVSALENALRVEAVECFLSALPHSRLVVQIALINALERLQSPSCAEALSRFLETTESPELRYNLIQALGKIGDSSLIPLIQRYLTDPDHHVHERAIIALALLANRSRRE